ncbi:MAG: rhamnulokinase [Acidilobus sp.]
MGKLGKSALRDLVVLAFDLGASSCRAMVGYVNEAEKAVRVEELYRWPNYMVRIGDSLYWDVLRIWHEMKGVIKAAYKRFGSKLASIGVDTWGIDFALLDASGQLVENPHTYRDPRTKGVSRELHKIVGPEEIFQCTGNHVLEINTLYQIYSLKLKRPAILNSAKTFLMVPDLFNYWLTGDVTNEFSEATTTQMFDIRNKRWCLDIITRLGLPADIFSASIIEPGTELGTITPALASELGIPKDIGVIAPATHDTGSAIAAAPQVDESTGYISSGTWSLVGVELKEPLFSEDGLRYNFTNEGGAFGTITYLKDLQGMWLVEESRRVLAERGLELSYEEIVSKAMSAPSFTSFIDTDDDRFISPLNMVDEIMRFIDETGQRRPANEGELFRVIYESLAFKYRLTFEQIEEVTKRRLERINVFGGGSRNSFLNQLIADFTGLPVFAGPDEATAIGNVLLQAAGLGVVKSLADLRQYVKLSYGLKEFTPSEAKRVEEAYSAYLKIVRK